MGIMKNSAVLKKPVLPSEESGNKVSILIVDDLPEKLMSYEAILDELGQNLVTARSGEEALKLVLNQEFAVILLDVNMPGMDGFETAELIRQRRKSSHTPIIFLTAFTDEVRMAQGYASGAVDYLPTPVIPEILKAKIKVFIELSQMRRQAAQQAEERARRTAAENLARRSQFLVRVGEILSTSPSWKEIVRAMVQLPIPELADLAILHITNTENQTSLLKYCWHKNGELHVQSVAEDHLLAQWVEKSVKTSSSGPTEFTFNFVPPAAERQLAPWAKMKTALSLPIIVQGQIEGVLILARQTENDYSKEDISLAYDFASRASNAIENVLLVERIRNADRRKDEFLAMLAHELRNPLAPINNALHVMRVSQAASARDKALDVIDCQTKHMIHLVDDLMDVSRITQGKIELRRETVSLQEALQNAIESAEPMITQRGQNLTLEIEEAPLWIHADITRISQIFSNLLNNAAKYTHVKGNILLRCRREGSEAVVSVIDNGIGIPAAMLKQVFDLFTQVDSSLERAQGGLGIGLTLVKNLTEMHGGTIVALSNGANQGSEFTVRLPLTEAANTKAAAQSISAPAQSMRVLVVDDNEASALTMMWMIELGGHEVKMVHDGRQAIELAKTYKPSVVLLDIGLPGMNGYEICKEMRKDPLHKDTYFVAQTGWGQPEHRRRSQEAGFHHHLVKPVNIATLEELLRGIKPKE